MTQKVAIARCAEARGDDGAAFRWFVESRSATTLARPELAALRAAVRAGDVRRVYVFRVDRLTRTGIRDTLALVEEFRGAGAELVSVADGFDLTGPASDIVLAVMAWAAQMERAALGERISAARERVAAAGGAWGRPLRVSEAKRAKILELAQRDRTVRSIAQAVGVPKSTVARVLSQKGGYKRKAARTEKKATKTGKGPLSK